MSENWQVGDMALCIHSGPWHARTHDDIITVRGPRAGAKLTVREVLTTWRGTAGLLFTDFPDPVIPRTAGYAGKCFRKLAPPEADEFDREVIAALTGQPEQVPA